MGRIRKGILGGFRGTTGPVVGSFWRRMAVMRSKPRKIAKHKKKLLLLQQSKLSSMSTFLTMRKELIEVGFKKKGSKKTPMNLAMEYNIAHAFSETSGVLAIDYSKIRLCKGNRERAWSEQIFFEPGCKVSITWDVPELLNHKLIGNDTAHIVFHNAEDWYMSPRTVLGIRSEKSVLKQLPASITGHVIHAWIYFVSPDGTKISDSDYIGSGVVIA